MADPPRYADTGDTGMEPDRESTTGPPRWVKVLAIAGMVMVVLVIVVMLASGGEHGPGRHTSGVEAPRHLAAS